MLNKVLKIALCCVAGVCAFTVALIDVAVNVVFTPDRLTQMAREQLSQLFTCQADVGHVELSFFSTFPRVVLHAQDFSLVNPTEGAPSDTLLALHALEVPLSPLTLYAQHRVDVGEVHLSDLRLSLYTATDGRTNYDVLAPQGESEGLPFGLETIRVEELWLEPFAVSYVDRESGVEAALQRLVARVQGPVVYPVEALDLVVDARFASLCLTDNMGRSLSVFDWGVDDLQFSTSAECLLPEGLAMEFGGLSLSCPDDAAPLSFGLQQTSLSLPNLTLCEGYGLSYCLDAGGVTFSTDSRLISGLPVHVQGRAKVSAALDELDLAAQDWRIGEERLCFDASLHRSDSLRARVALNLHLQPTTLDRLLALVPPAFRSPMAALADVHGAIDGLEATLSLDLQSPDSLLLQQFDVKAQLSDLDYLTDVRHWVRVSRCDVALRYPVAHPDLPIGQLVESRLVVDKAHALMHESSRYELLADSFLLHGYLSGELLDGVESLPYLSFDTLASHHLRVHADTLSADLNQLNLDLTLNELPDGRKNYDAKVDGQGFELSAGLSVAAVGDAFQMEASSLYEPGNPDLLLRYNPVFNMTVENGNIEVSGLPYSFEFPQLDFDFSLGVFMVREWLVNYGRSFLSLSGEVTHLRDFLQHTGALQANLALESPYVDVMELRDLIDGLGAAEDTTTSSDDEVSNYLAETLGSLQTEPADSTGQAPFIVPRNLDLLLDVNLERAKVGRHLFADLGGRVQIQQGTMRFEQLGFNSEAARMVLNSTYQSPQPDNLQLSANFHLFDVQIDSLMSLVPGIDSVMPMLLTLAGSGEFHLDMDATLSGDYAPDLTSLRAKGAFVGTDLSLLDVETFQKMSRYLHFSKNTPNRFDSLDVVFKVADGQVRLLPFTVGMDRYSAVVSGTHVLTGPTPSEYHASIVKAPLVGGRLGINVTGDILQPESLQFRLARCRYGRSAERTEDEEARSQLTEKSLIFNEIKQIKSR